MATKIKDKTKISTRKPWGRLSEDVKEKILCEINSGMLSKSAASRKYGLPRSTIGLWFEKRNLAILAQASSSNVLSAMDENQETRLLKKKIDELTAYFTNSDPSISVQSGRQLDCRVNTILFLSL
nr:hypothetical protein [Pedobacter sp. ASV2]